MQSTYAVIKKRITGALLIALGVFALTTPLIAGRWSLAFLGLPLIAMGIAEAYAAFMSPRSSEASAYLPGVLAFLAGNILLLSSALVFRGLLVLLIAILTIDGFWKIIAAWHRSYPDRLPLVLNGIVDLGSAAVIWYLSLFIGITQAIGIIVGAYILAAGWRLLMAPVEICHARYGYQSVECSPELENSPSPGTSALTVCVPRRTAGRSSCALLTYCGCQRLGSCFWRSMPAVCR